MPAAPIVPGVANASRSSDRPVLLGELRLELQEIEAQLQNAREAQEAARKEVSTPADGFFEKVGDWVNGNKVRNLSSEIAALEADVASLRSAIAEVERTGHLGTPPPLDVLTKRIADDSARLSEAEDAVGNSDKGLVNRLLDLTSIDIYSRSPEYRNELRTRLNGNQEQLETLTRTEGEGDQVKASDLLRRTGVPIGGR